MDFRRVASLCGHLFSFRWSWFRMIAGKQSKILRVSAMPVVRKRTWQMKWGGRVASLYYEWIPLNNYFGNWLIFEKWNSSRILPDGIVWVGGVGSGRYFQETRNYSAHDNLTFVLESLYRSNSSHLFRDKKEKEKVIGKKDTPLSAGLPSDQWQCHPLNCKRQAFFFSLIPQEDSSALWDPCQQSNTDSSRWQFWKRNKKRPALCSMSTDSAEQQQYNFYLITL